MIKSINYDSHDLKDNQQITKKVDDTYIHIFIQTFIYIYKYIFEEIYRLMLRLTLSNFFFSLVKYDKIAFQKSNYKYFYVYI